MLSARRGEQDGLSLRGDCRLQRAQPNRLLLSPIQSRWARSLLFCPHALSMQHGRGQLVVRNKLMAIASGAEAFLRQLHCAAALLQPTDALMLGLLQVFVNDEPIQIPKGWSLLQACDAAGIDIPR